MKTHEKVEELLKKYKLENGEFEDDPYIGFYEGEILIDGVLTYKEILDLGDIIKQAFKLTSEKGK